MEGRFIRIQDFGAACEGFDTLLLYVSHSEVFLDQKPYVCHGFRFVLCRMFYSIFRESVSFGFRTILMTDSVLLVANFLMFHLGPPFLASLLVT